MRPVVYALTASLDGYICRPDGSIDWIVTETDRNRAKFFGCFDAVIMGRKSHDKMLEFGGPDRAFYPGMNNYVVSQTAPPGRRNGVEFVSGDLRHWVNDLRKKPGKKIWLSGGGELARSFLDLNLIDEISLAVQPILLGHGVPLFPAPFQESKLKLESATPLASGIVQLTYQIEK